MTTLILEPDNQAKVEAIKAFAKEMDIKIIEKEAEQETEDYFYLKGVKVRKAKGKIDLEKMSGSIPNIDMDPETFRKKAWSRNKI